TIQAAFRGYQTRTTIAAAAAQVSASTAVARVAGGGSNLQAELAAAVGRVVGDLQRRPRLSLGKLVLLYNHLNVQLESRNQIITGELFDKVITGTATVGDVIATANATYDVILGLNGDTPGYMSFLTASSWAAPMGAVTLLLSIANAWKKVASGDSTWIDEAPPLVLATCRLTAGAYGFLDLVGVAVAETNVIGPFALSAGIVTELVSLYGAFQSHRSLASAQGRARQLLNLPNNGLDPEMSELLKELLAKFTRRKIHNGVEAASSVIGLSAGAFALAGTFTCATLITPIGWGLVGATTLTAFGHVGYKTARRQHKKNQARQMRANGEPIPTWLRTSGDWHRFRLAYYIHSGCHDLLDDSSNSAGKALAVVLFGGLAEDAEKTAREHTMFSLMTYMKKG
ncbi:MAG: hypothetical protein AAGC55_21000, partial [Myxococcota bacterium]